MKVSRTRTYKPGLIFAAWALLFFSTTTAQAQTIGELKEELEKLKQQMNRLQQKIESQEVNRKEDIEKKSSEPAALSDADKKQITEEATQNAIKAMQAPTQTASVSSPGEFNPAIGFFIDTAAAFKEHNSNNFEFRAAELAISANVDPFTKGYGIINGTPDGVEIEEAAIQTTALPANLKASGGRFFADFGRLSKFHDHDLPFVNRPLALDRFVHGESQADGVEINWLAPTEQYFSLSAGAYNKIGGENERADNLEERGLGKFTYLGRVTTNVDLSDASSFDVGASYAFTPKVETEEDEARHLVGVDLTFRYIPPSEAAYQGLVWSTEWLYNREKRPENEFTEEEELSPDGEVDSFHEHGANGVYSYVETKLSRRLSPGFLFDYAEDLNGDIGATVTYSPYLTIWMSEFQRIRLQYSYLTEDGDHENQFFAQWTAVLGSHAHGFRER